MTPSAHQPLPRRRINAIRLASQRHTSHSPTVHSPLMPTECQPDHFHTAQKNLMRILNTCVACVIALLQPLHASAAPVPDSKLAYVGEWVGTSMRLNISQDGKIAYKRTGVDLKVDITIELAAFDGDNFSAGVGPFRTTFLVSQPPHSKGSRIKMVVDGVELTKVD